MAEADALTDDEILRFADSGLCSAPTVELSAELGEKLERALSRTALPLMLTAAQVGEQLGVSAREIRRMNLQGDLPEPLKMGHKKVRWRRDELVAWIDAGCPDRDAWLRHAGRAAQKSGRP
ncbi:Prophage CP4-57 regulatory protein (AlpA) [Posidoniimonas corsicana]|uniref:Prophage CP4-57 regulatory protein (AlpA) n=1 Tax=Posidoniimonas corsicana TaxID=1938618 RepID=A0A5C5V743_9BACT|nr:helix-turn-helix domain-containing protein [Posidoniimonas corsicana]TWT33900.1 Prophage CP4-57 regulatory protein (AlpA) [Posidoniimonas corsicana]